jgi:hypothetical protein
VSSAVAEAFAELAHACAKVAAALRAENRDEAHPHQQESAAPHAKPERAAREPKPQRPLALADGQGTPAGFGKTTRKILVALAQLGRPSSAAQVGLLTGLSHTAGSFTKALADLRANDLIAGTGAAMTITPAGAAWLGEYAPLPEGHALFDFWCSKLGTTAEKILRALKKSRVAMSAEEVGVATALSHTAGSFTKALAELRRMQLIEGPGTGMRLSAELLLAIEPKVRVFDTTNGRTVRVNQKGHVD